MRRRELLKAAGASLATLAAPRIGRAERPSKLAFVPTEDLGVLDPHFAGPRSRRNHAHLVFDTLYGIDTSWGVQPQMIEGHQVEEDGQTWTLRLRDGLRFSRQGAGAGARRCCQHSPFCRPHQSC